MLKFNFKNNLMENEIIKAKKILKKFKGDNYIFGLNCLDSTGDLAVKFGEKILLIISGAKWADGLREKILKSLNSKKIKVLKIVDGSKPNTPREDVYRIQDEIEKLNPELLVVVGGGSTIDCVKASSILATYTPGKHEIEPFFGTGMVTEFMNKAGKKKTPILAVQVASSSGAHLTKYANVTDIENNQKKLIVDDEIIPEAAIFDYSVTISMGRDLTIDGAMDGIAHALEVYYGATNDKIDEIEEVALLTIDIIVKNLPKVLKEPENLKYREKIGIGTDLGGYAIMIGGTNGGHLTSFSLVDIITHGRACSILNPYYTVFFAPAILRQLRNLYGIYSEYIEKDLDLESVSARELGEAVATAMRNFSRSIGVPVKLQEVKGFADEHISRAVAAASDPQLEMKLKNMPVPLNSSNAGDYMKLILESAKTGDFSIIKN
jgi:alcohol dehydrogenase